VIAMVKRLTKAQARKRLDEASRKIMQVWLRVGLDTNMGMTAKDRANLLNAYNTCLRARDKLK
jgi:hypothetical protein